MTTLTGTVEEELVTEAVVVAEAVVAGSCATVVADVPEPSGVSVLPQANPRRTETARTASVCLFTTPV
ncbi:MAG: hypothetical protein OXJ36_06145 [bacterium]|nr:hypothetical protein [bacterium]MDE0437964.1 hypothetical protein [bacterium]